MSELVYGIDLGTTYSAIAKVSDVGTIDVVRNFEGKDTTPSAIFFEDGDNVVVGSEAKNVALSDPGNACLLIKRQMGTDYTVEYGGKEWTPESLSALILKELVKAANQESGEDANKVVITVPAYFGTQEKEATRQAGAIAGLDVVGIVTEPVAAALSIGIKGDKAETVMVYDLGGGTFDTTIMKVDSGKVEVVAIDGNRLLGGADWDAALVDLILDKFVEATGSDEARYDDEFLLELRLDAEALKQSLTRRTEATARLSFGSAREAITVTREEFEAATQHLVDQTVEICRRTLATGQEKDPGLTIDRMLLVGGSSRMPMVRAALTEQLGWACEDTDFDLAVAKGAAIYGQAAIEEVLATDGEEPAAAKNAPKLFLNGASSLSVSNVLSRGLGIRFHRPEDDSSFISFFAHANDSIPVECEPIHAFTSAEGQTQVEISLYEQGGDSESLVVEDNKELNSVELPFAGPMPKQSPIDIQVIIDAEGILRLKAVDPKSGNSADLESRVSCLTAEQVAAATSQVSSIQLRS